MKSFIVVTSMCFVLSLLACQETKEDLKSPLSERDHYKTIGEEIPFETGMEWIAYYKKKKSEQGRIELLSSSYEVPAAQVNAMLESVTDLVGVAFHYGIDALGKMHILLIPVDGSLSLWSPISGRIFIDANTGTEINQSVAYAWALNYKNAYPNEIWFHFFGKNIFDEINALPYFNSIDIEQAISVLDLTPELLLVIWKEELISIGRTNREQGAVFDASNPCPPCAVQ